jgi:putative NADPH-quinone reductase
VKVLVVRAHPLEESYNAALLERTLRGLGRAGHAVDLLDLYADDFDPRVGATERRTYRDPDAIPADIAPYAARLRTADSLVLVFPVWCFGVPAILKGFFDRVLRPGVAFVYTADNVVRPTLQNIRKIAAVTTYGRPRWMVWYVGDLPRRQVTRYVRWFCHPQAGAEYLAHYHMNASTQASRAAYSDRVERRMAAL